MNEWMNESVSEGVNTLDWRNDGGWDNLKDSNKNLSQRHFFPP